MDSYDTQLTYVSSFAVVREDEDQEETTVTKQQTLKQTFHLRSKRTSSAANLTYVFMSQDKQPCHGGRSPKLMMSSDSLQQNPF